MASVPINDIEEGSKLAYPVIDSQGRIILAAGVVLSQGLLDKLKHWRISAVSIDNGESLQESSDQKQAEQSLQEYWQQLFDSSKLTTQQEIIQQALLTWYQKSAAPEESNKSQ